MNTSNALPYRPRNAGHDYYGRGTYLVTLVVSGRERLLSRFATDLGHKTTLALTPLGEAVQEAWLQIPARSQTHGNKVVVHACVCMPDHFHGVIEVLEPFTLTRAPLSAACQRSNARNTTPLWDASSDRSSMITTTTRCALTSATVRR